MRTAAASILAAIAIVAFAGAAGAQQNGITLPERTSHAAAGEVTRVPYGWADLCGRQPQECQVNVLEAEDLHLTPKSFALLDEVNREVNAEIEPISNFDHWGTMLDHWDYPTDGKGDCKIYALWKRKLLIDRGVPR